MSKKHYIEIAKVLKALTARKSASIVAHELASVFKRDNSAFDFGRFHDACDVTA